MFIIGHAAAEPQLHVAISKRIPSVTDTVRLGAYFTGEDAPARAGPVVFHVEVEGRRKVIGKALPASYPDNPFEPSVEWAPGRNGLYRIIARAQDGDFEGRLLVPVVEQDVYFAFYGRTRPEAEWMTHHLTASQAEIPALHARGVVALKHVGGVSYLGGARPEDIRPDLDVATLAPRIIRDYTDIDPYDGIAIDELGMWDQHPLQTELALGFWEALKQARASRPDKFFATWQFASLTPLVCNIFRDTTDLVMCEVYQNYFRAWYDQHTFYEFIRQRIDMARRMMIIKQTVIGLSISTDYGGITPEELEDQVRFIRATGPEMRGLAFYTTSRCEDAVLKAANDCCYRYFVKPAVGLFSDADLTLSHYQPEEWGTVRIFATVHNVGGMDALNVAVRFWDGDPAGGGTQIGETQIIPRLPAARWVDPEARDQAGWEPAEAMRRDGFGMVTVSVPWQARTGPRALWAEVVPDPQYTVIRGFQDKRITVR